MSKQLTYRKKIYLLTVCLEEACIRLEESAERDALFGDDPQIAKLKMKHVRRLRERAGLK